MPRPNRTGVDWSDPDAAREYNNQYKREQYQPVPPDEVRAKRVQAGKASTQARRAQSPLTVDDVRAIRQAYRDGATVSEIAGRYPVGVMAISNIVNRKTWKDVD